MDSSTQAVRAFLDSMLPVQEAQADLLRQLYKRPQVKRVHSYVMEAVPSPDLGLSADLRNGAGIDFWITLTSEDFVWELECLVLRHDPDEDGSHTEVEFPRRSVRSVHDLPAALLGAIAALERASADDALYR